MRWGLQYFRIGVSIMPSSSPYFVSFNEMMATRVWDVSSFFSSWLQRQINISRLDREFHLPREEKKAWHLGMVLIVCRFLARYHVRVMGVSNVKDIRSFVPPCFFFPPMSRPFMTRNRSMMSTCSRVDITETPVLCLGQNRLLHLIAGVAINSICSISMRTPNKALPSALLLAESHQKGFFQVLFYLKSFKLEAFVSLGRLAVFPIFSTFALTKSWKIKIKCNV